MKNFFLATLITLVTFGVCEENMKFLEENNIPKPGYEHNLLQIPDKLEEQDLVGTIKEFFFELENSYLTEDFLNRIKTEIDKNSSGEYIEYWPNGKMKIKAPYKNKKADSHIHGWYENGYDAFKGFFKEGIRQGIHMTFFKRKDSEGHYKRLLSFNEQGQLHGEQLICHDSSLLKAIVVYKNGILDGTTSYFKDTAKLSLEETHRVERRRINWTYKKGKLINLTLPE